MTDDSQKRGSTEKQGVPEMPPEWIENPICRHCGKPLLDPEQDYVCLQDYIFYHGECYDVLGLMYAEHVD